MEKGSSFQQMILQLNSIWKKESVSRNLITLHNMKSKWVIDTNIKNKTIKLLENIENLDIELC